MTDIPDFSDFSKAEAWLETQPHPVRIALAARSALRVVPALAGLVPSKSSDLTKDSLILTCLRAILVAGARALYTTPATSDLTERLAISARSAADSASSAADSARSAAASAAYFAASSAAYSAASSAYSADSAYSAADSAAYSAADSAYSAADSAADSARSAADSAARSAATNDAVTLTSGAIHDVFANPLWPEGKIHNRFAQDWQSWKSELAKNPDWDFWIRWYDALWSGTPLNWDLQTQIALIPDITWDAGLAQVAQAIRDIEDARWPSSILNQEAAATQARFLIQNAQFASAQAQSLSSIISQASQAYRMEVCNALPDALEPLDNLPPLLTKISVVLAGTTPLDEREAELADALMLAVNTVSVLNQRLRGAHTEIQELKGRMAELVATNDLGLFAKKEAIKTLCSPPLWTAIVSGGFFLFGINAMGLLTEVQACVDDVMGTEAVRVVKEMTQSSLPKKP